MDGSLWAPVIAALFGGGAITGIGSAILQRRKVGADATAVITEAARELVDPLRKELATERSENAKEVEAQRMKVARLTKELEAVEATLRVIRAELVECRADLDVMRRERERDRARIRELESR